MSAAGKFKDCFKEISKMIQESFVEFFFLALIAASRAEGELFFTIQGSVSVACGSPF